MTIIELRDKRFSIIFEALLNGVQIPYKRGWRLWYCNVIPNGKNREIGLCQIYYDKEKKVETTHKSAVGLNDFIFFVQNISDEELKRIYSNNQLIKLQNKLEKAVNYEDDCGDEYE